MKKKPKAEPRAATATNIVKFDPRLLAREAFMERANRIFDRLERLRFPVDFTEPDALRGTPTVRRKRP